MPITLVTGPANAGKAEVVLDSVRRHIAHGSEPMLVVPTRADAEHYLRELAGSRVAMGLRVERFAGLIGEAARRAGLGGQVLGRVSREQLLWAIAARGGVRHASSGLVRSMGDLFAELQVRRVTPSRLDGALARWVAVDGAAADQARVGHLFAGYRAGLERLGRMDADQQAVRALDLLRERPALWEGTPVLFYGFDDLTPLQLDTIETLGRVVGADVTVSLSFEAGRTAFAGRAESFYQLAPLAEEHVLQVARREHYAPGARAPLSHLERSLFEPGTVRVAPAGAVRLLEGGGERAELELVAGEIAGLLGRGFAPEDIAVLVRPGGTEPGLLEEVLAAAGIPFVFRRTRTLADTAIGRAIIGLLRCVPSPQAPAEGQLGDLLAWLRAPGVLSTGAPDGGALTLADWLERRARRAGALRADQARELWEERHWTLETIDRLRDAQARGPAALIDRASRELSWIFSAPRRSAASVLGGDELPEAAALAAGRRALRELGELARRAPGLAPATAGDLAGALASLQIGGREDEVKGAVAVLDPLDLRARRVRALFICGLQEGVFPAGDRPAPMLAGEDRRRLAEVSGLLLEPERDAVAADRYLFYAAVSRPEELLFLSWHAAGDEGEATPRSLFVDDVCDLFEESLMRDRARRPMGAVDSSTLAPPVAAPGEPNLTSEELLGPLRARVWSASSLKSWIGCPVRWFVDSLLDPRALDPDAEPLARGSLAHAALKDTLEGLRGQTGSARLHPGNLALARELLAGALAENESRHPLSVAPERRAALRRRLQADLERYLAQAAENPSPLEPGPLELGFGFGEDDERAEGSTLPAVDLGEGLHLRGRIDRIDVDDTGQAVIYDYKGSRAPAGARWTQDSELQVALYMRAAEDLLGVRAVGGFYQPLAGETLRARGVLDADSGLELPCMTQDLRTHEEVRELLAEAVAAARQVVEESGAGRLEARPQTCAFGGGCSYPTICRCER